MRFRWPADTVFTQRILTVEQATCALCERLLAICDHRCHRIFTFQGPVEIVCKLVHCPDPHGPAHAHTLSPLAEAQLTRPWWTIGWDVFCWLGHRRFARHWSIPQLRAELQDTYHSPLSDAALAGYLRRYQTMVAARQQDAVVLAHAYQEIDSLLLTIDGLQPEKGHETLYVVRELRAKRVWFAEALLSSATAEVQRLVSKAKQWAQQLGKPVQLGMSDKQEAFITALAAAFPKVPHRYGQNHCWRDVAKPTLEADRHAKVKMRRKVRGLRAIAQQVLAQRQGEAKALPAAPPAGTTVPEASAPPSAAARTPGPDGGVLDYCAAVRGIRNDAQGGPLAPPGLRMAAALGEVRESLQRNLDAKKGGARRSNGSGWPTGLTGVCRQSLRSRHRCGSTSARSRRSKPLWSRAKAAAPVGSSVLRGCSSAWQAALTRCGSRWRW
jgi:hypothetical protein